MSDLELKQSNGISGDADAQVDSETSEQDRTNKRHPLRDILETLVIAALIFLLVRSVVLNFRIDGPSMLPSFEDGQMILVNRNAYQSFDVGDLVDWIPGVPEQHWFTIVDWGEPERGDVIVFTPPEPGQQKPYIKRVIALPGDHVQITDDRTVLVNGVELEEEYIGDYTTRCTNSPMNCDVTVPPGHVFTLGDNRNGSEDSRFYGMVSEDRIIGKAWMVYWPITDIGPIGSPDYPELKP